jgi:hypothetical protein
MSLSLPMHRYNFAKQEVRDWFVQNIVAPTLKVADGAWLDGNGPDNVRVYAITCPHGLLSLELRHFGTQGAYMCGGICCGFNASNSPQNQSQISTWCDGEKATAVAAHKYIIARGGYEYHIRLIRLDSHPLTWL